MERRAEAFIAFFTPTRRHRFQASDMEKAMAEKWQASRLV